MKYVVWLIFLQTITFYAMDLELQEKSSFDTESIRQAILKSDVNAIQKWIDSSMPYSLPCDLEPIKALAHEMVKKTKDEKHKDGRALPVCMRALLGMSTFLKTFLDSTRYFTPDYERTPSDYITDLILDGVLSVSVVYSLYVYLGPENSIRKYDKSKEILQLLEKLTAQRTTQ